MLLWEESAASSLSSFNSPEISKEHKFKLGQFFTPEQIATFMASLFTIEKNVSVSLLDAGAGQGALSKAFIERIDLECISLKSFDITVYEIDETVTESLKSMLASYQNRLKLDFNIVSKDFIEETVVSLLSRTIPKFTHAILNPPYKKINSLSAHRQLLRQAGIETVNLYSAFVALTLELIQPGGQVVAIIPRSFCNGPYYKRFRELLLSKGSIEQIHLFKTRDKAFKQDSVLQENIIISIKKESQKDKVIISTSTDHEFIDYQSQVYPFLRIVSSSDPERFIHIPNSENCNMTKLSHIFCCSLKDLGIEVSTGPVVDFRLKEHLRDIIEPNTVPLLYPNNISSKQIEWPKEKSKKPCAIVCNNETERRLYPNGFYTVVRRFSSKEEKRRVVAGFVNPERFKADKLGFENHLNVFHSQKKGLPEELARGLAAFLNLELIDNYFRQFNGHTQVNATDLKMLKYPSKDQLIKLGAWLKKQNLFHNEETEAKILEFLHG